jgi:hypothetical protein
VKGFGKPKPFDVLRVARAGFLPSGKARHILLQPKRAS